MILTEDIQRSADESVLCWLATSSPTGEPNVSPKEIFACFGDTEIIVANIASPRTITNLHHNPRVCLSFIHVFRQKGYQLHGNGDIIREGHDDFDARAEPLRKIAGVKFPFDTIIRIVIDHARPIVAPRYVLYPETTEAEQVESAMELYGVKPT